MRLERVDAGRVNDAAVPIVARNAAGDLDGRARIIRNRNVCAGKPAENERLADVMIANQDDVVGLDRLIPWIVTVHDFLREKRDHPHR
jgi:hypothetical protein